MPAVPALMIVAALQVATGGSNTNVREPNTAPGAFAPRAPEGRSGALALASPEPCAAHGVGAASRDAHVVSTYPAFGATVRSGQVLVRITYDQEMSPCYAFLLHGPSLAIRADRPVVLSADRRSFLLPLVLEGGDDFQVSLDDRSLEGFRSASGGRGLPYTLTFRTHLGKGEASLAAAARLDPEFEAIDTQPGDVLLLRTAAGPAEPTHSSRGR